MSESKTKYQRLAKAALVLNGKVDVLQEELAGLLRVLYLLAVQNGGSIVITDAEFAAVPGDARLQMLRDEAKEECVFVAKQPEEQAVVETPVNDGV